MYVYTRLGDTGRAIFGLAWGDFPTAFTGHVRDGEGTCGEDVTLPRAIEHPESAAGTELRGKE